MPYLQGPLTTIPRSSRWTDPPMVWCPSPVPSSPYPSRSQKGPPPDRAPAKRDAPYLEPSNYLLKFPVKGLPGFPKWAPTEMGTCIENFLHFSLKVPSKWAPSSCSPIGSQWREKLHLQSQWFSHSFISVGVPNKEPSHENRRQCLVTIHRAPHGRKAYIQWGAVWFPKGIVYDTTISTAVPCSLQHDTFHLGLGRPEPR